MESVFGNGTLSTSTTWKPEPDTRGTFSILSTCLITLGLCVWTAVHLNVPGRYDGQKEKARRYGWKLWANAYLWPARYLGWPVQTFRKVGWTILGFLTPEVVAFTAYRQFMEAADLTRVLRAQFSASDLETGSTGASNPWTLTHSFFVIMGGLEVVLQDESTNWLPRRWGGERRNCLTLTAKGLLLLAQRHPNLIRDLSLQQIQDKSKGGTFAKTLVCFQALWFCVQCLTRFGQRLGISLLELNTFGHALCTLGLYIVWWYKPLDVQEPLPIHIPADGPEAENIAIMCMTSRLDGIMPEIKEVYPRLELSGQFQDNPGLRLTVCGPTDLDCYFETPPHGRRDLQSYPSSSRTDRPSSSPPVQIQAFPDTRNTSHSWNIELFIPFQLCDESAAGTARFEFRSPLGNVSTCTKPAGQSDNDGKHELDEDMYTIDILHSNLRRYILAAKHVDEWTEPLTDNPYVSSSGQIPRSGYRDSFTDRISNLPRLQPIRTDWRFYLGFGIVGFAYGGLHCLAWNAPFHTQAEQLLWRSSSVVLAATGILLIHLYTWELSGSIIGDLNLRHLTQNLKWFHKRVLYSHLSARLYTRSESFSSEHIDQFKYIQKWDATALVILPLVVLLTIVKVVYDLFVSAFIIVYIVARIFLVVECFINLTHLPESAYLVPQWSQYMPHIG